MRRWSVMAKQQVQSSDGAQSTTFEAAIEQVEAIIERIESGEIGLEESLAEYERGIGLIGFCRERLQKAQQRVIDLTQKLAQADKPAEG